MKLHLPRPANKLSLGEWSKNELTIGSVSDDEFMEMFARLPKPTKKKLYHRIRNHLS